MPTKVEKDAVTGEQTTGHEWDGIKELNTPLPKWWLYVLYATILFSLGYWVLYPSFPGFTGYLKGVLGTNNRLAFEEKMVEARGEQAAYLARIAERDAGAVAEDPELLNFAMAGGRAVFADNCAPCHGLGGAGQFGYPTLADDVWLWGGTLQDIKTTILYGVRSNHEETRISEMPAFGADGLLSREEISQVAEFVLSLSGQSKDSQAIAQGREVYAINCAACHGESGEGNTSLGAPRLNDQIWLYGDSKEQVVAQISQPRHGVMPAWSDRLDETTIKMLAVYVHALGGGQ